MENKGPNGWIRGAVWAIGLSLGVVTMLFSALYNAERSISIERHDDTEQRIEDISRRKQLIAVNVGKLQREVSTLAERVDDHNSTSEEWKNRITSIERILYKLQSDSSARPDPWTGTEGRAEARRVDRIEVLIGLLQSQINEIKEEISQ